MIIYLFYSSERASSRFSKLAMKKIFFLLTISAFILSSCSSIANFNYFQDTANGDVNQIPSLTEAIKVKPYDKIYIFISCKDPQLSSIYNLITVTRRIGNQNGNGSNTSSSSVTSYTIDADGDVEVPVLGKIHVGGLTRGQIADLVKNKLTTSAEGVKDATVTVEFANLHIGVLGEVRNQGIISIDRDQFTLLDAISRAGDLTQYGNRKNVKVFRKDGTALKTYEVDLTNFQDVCQSPVYMLQQDDVIYVEPNKVRARQSTATGNTLLTPSFWMSVLSVALSVAVFVTKF